MNLFCWHQWSKWEDVGEVIVHPHPSNLPVGVNQKETLPIAKGIKQSRRCAKCNIVQLRTEWY